MSDLSREQFEAAVVERMKESGQVPWIGGEAVIEAETFAESDIRLICGDCLETMRTLPDNSVDSVVTDPPYGLSFMGKKWDYDVPSTEIWAECLRVLKPGGHLLAFAGTRTQHRMAVRIEDAGFEIRDMIAWVYGSGFPKSMDVSKAIDKAAGAERNLTRAGVNRREGYGDDWDKGDSSTRPRYDDPATATAAKWQGWGTALKPALEPITVARKPLNGTVAANVLAHGTGALNIDACRVAPTGERLGGGDESGKAAKPEGWARPWMDDPDHVAAHNSKVAANVDKASQLGRWPANLIHDGSAEVIAHFPDAPGQLAAASTSDTQRAGQNCYGMMKRGRGNEASANSENAGAVGFKMKPGARRLDTGSAARFFYCAKTSRKDRNEGLTDPGPQFKHGTTLRKVESAETQGNNHPTVKPTDLMRYLCRLVTPAGGLVLDPFMGSGSTGKAASLEGFRFVGIELDPDYFAIAKARVRPIERQQDAQRDLFSDESRGAAFG
ncbi:site-specific DNA-methyltransferase [Pseudomonas sp. UMAB-08]|uniref:DNA-methyltransferase n=1 Tax=Pseudomonas sp. UMAB-08 TaxID=1365375 RepID=UPI0035A69082